MWPFGRKRVVDPDTAAWLSENMAWLIREFGQDSFARSTLVLPKPGFFVTDGETGHALALRIFDQVKAYCGMSEWPVDLVPDDNPAAALQAPSIVMVAPQPGALGTFGLNGNRIEITYSTQLLNRPDRLIATLAHELAHYLLATAKEPPPADADEHEFLTDLAAVYLGFGVFLANSRFDFETMSEGLMQGWQWQRSGYLPEADLIFGLALFLRARGIDGEAAQDSLKPHLATLLRRALGELTHDSPHVRRVGEARQAAKLERRAD